MQSPFEALCLRAVGRSVGRSRQKGGTPLKEGETPTPSLDGQEADKTRQDKRPARPVLLLSSLVQDDGRTHNNKQTMETQSTTKQSTPEQSTSGQVIGDPSRALPPLISVLEQSGSLSGEQTRKTQTQTSPSVAKSDTRQRQRQKTRQVKPRTVSDHVLVYSLCGGLHVCRCICHQLHVLCHECKTYQDQARRFLGRARSEETRLRRLLLIMRERPRVFTRPRL